MLTKKELILKLQEGKQKTAMRCLEVARAYLPKSYTIKYRKSLTGRANVVTKKIEAPKPITKKALLVWLHECGHIHYQHNRQTGDPRFVQEYLAETYALTIMKAEGIKVTRKMINESKIYISWRINQAIERKLNEERARKKYPEIFKWVEN